MATQLQLTQPISVNDYPAVPLTYPYTQGVVYLSWGPNPGSQTISPFNEFGEPYTAQQILDLELYGTYSPYPAVNYTDVLLETVYLIRNPETYVATKDLDAARTGYEITGIYPQGILKVQVYTKGGILVQGIANPSVTQMDVQEVMRNPWLE